MQQSQYKTEAYVYDGVNQQRALDSLEGSAAILQADKPRVDGTDIQKEQILAKANDQQAVVQSLTPGKRMKKTASRHRSPIQTRKKS
jgi:hypothetical protein